MLGDYPFLRDLFSKYGEDKTRLTSLAGEEI